MYDRIKFGYVRDMILGLPEVKWGIYPFGGATAKLVAH